MVLNAVAHASTEIRVGCILVQHNHTVKVDDHGHSFVIFGLHHFLLHYFKNFFFFKGIVLQKQFVVDEKDVTDVLLGKEVN